jgi:predicted DNA binding protein
MEQKKDEILVIMKQRADQGFWPVFMQGAWGLVPPIQVDQNFTKVTIVTNESFDPDLMENIQSLADTVEIISMERVDGEMASLGKWHSVPWSYFTPRQREIASYAVQQGYFQIPKKIDTAQIGQHFQISAAAVSEHLRKIEQKLMHFVFG